MKMLLFVLSIFMFFLVFNSTLIGAKNVENNDDILLYEVISYHETIYENGELKE